MKVIITPNGDVELDVSNGEGQAALDLINALQAQANAKAASQDISQKHRTLTARMASLSKSQRQTYDLLIEFDSADGVHYTALAALLEASDGAVSHRLGLLETRGLVKRVSRGHYRAIRE